MTDEKEVPMPKQKPEEEITLTIGDIATVKTIIEIATTKGAFEAKDLAVVGITYDRITKWLLANQPETEAEETSESEGEKND